jgi:hypothetical protein
LPNRADATLRQQDENGQPKSLGLSRRGHMVLNHFAEQMTQRLRASAATRDANPADLRTAGGFPVATPALRTCYTPITQHDEQMEGEKR